MIRPVSEQLTHRIRPAQGDPAGALVLLHGRGADEHDLATLADALDPHRRLLALLPRAPLSLPPGGAHWYRVMQIGYPDPVTFWPSFELAAGWLDAVLAANGIDHEHTVLGGFSQGAVMSWALGLARGRPAPAAIIGLSGFVPTVDGLAYDLDRRQTRVAIGHGSLDGVIGVEFGRAARDQLTAAGLDVTYRESPMPHSIDPAFVEELRPWIAESLEAAATPRDTAR